MKEIIHYDPANIGKLHCDACGYDLLGNIVFSEDLIGTPCPKCKTDMLTRADFETTERILKFIDRINRWFGPFFGSEYAPGLGDPISMRIHNNETIIARRGES